MLRVTNCQKLNRAAQQVLSIIAKEPVYGPDVQSVAAQLASKTDTVYRKAGFKAQITAMRRIVSTLTHPCWQLAEFDGGELRATQKGRNKLTQLNKETPSRREGRRQPVVQLA